MSTAEFISLLHHFPENHRMLSWMLRRWSLIEIRLYFQPRFASYWNFYATVTLSNRYLQTLGFSLKYCSRCVVNIPEKMGVVGEAGNDWCLQVLCIANHGGVVWVAKELLEVNKINKWKFYLPNFIAWLGLAYCLHCSICTLCEYFKVKTAINIVCGKF